MDPTALANAQAGLDKASNTVNKGFTGALTGMFMGKGFQNQMNSAIAQGNSALDMAAKQTALMQTGTDATALVESVMDTGKTMNMNPVLKLGLKVKPMAGGEEFQMEVETWVSRIMIPRVGDMISIKYDPNDKTNVMVMGIVPPAAAATMQPQVPPTAPVPPAPAA